MSDPGRIDPQPPPVPEPARTHTDGRHLRGHDWEWRRRIRSNPHSHTVYRTVVGAVGTLVVVVGLVLVPFPGPGWFIVFLGVAILASEFAWAKRLLHWGRGKLTLWNAWVMTKPVWFRVLMGLLTLLLVWALFYAYFAAFGIPSYLPDFGERWLSQLPALGPPR